MNWKVVSTNFGKLELALNRLSDEGFGIWKLVILSPESTRTNRFVVIIIGRKLEKDMVQNGSERQAFAQTEAISLIQEESDETAIVKVSGAAQSEREATKDRDLDKNLSDKPWQGKLVDPEFRPDRRTGRFGVKEPSL